MNTARRRRAPQPQPPGCLQHESMSAVHMLSELRQMIYFRATDRWGVWQAGSTTLQAQQSFTQLSWPTRPKHPKDSLVCYIRISGLQIRPGLYSAAALPGTKHCLWRGCGFPACDFLDRCADWRPVTVEDCDREGHQLRRCRLKRY